MILRLGLLGLLCAGLLPLASAQDGTWTPENAPAGGGERDEEIESLLRDAIGEGPLEIRAELRPRVAARLAASDWYTRRNAACALRRAGAAECLDAILGALVREPEPLVTEELVRAVITFGPAALPRLHARLASAPPGDERAWLVLCAVAAGDGDEARVAELVAAMRASANAAFPAQGRIALAASGSWAGARALLELARSRGSYDDLWRLAELRDVRLDEALLALAAADPRATATAIGLLVHREVAIPQDLLVAALGGTAPPAEATGTAVMAAIAAVARRPFPAGIDRLLALALGPPSDVSLRAAQALLDCWGESSAAVLAGLAPHAPGWRAPITIARAGEEITSGDARAEGLAPFVEKAGPRGGVLRAGAFALTWRKHSHVWATAVFPTRWAATVARFDGRTPFADLSRAAAPGEPDAARCARLCLQLTAGGLLVWDAPAAAWDPAELTRALADAPAGEAVAEEPVVVPGFWGE